MVIMDTKQVKLVWATKPRPDAEIEARRRVYATVNGMAIPRPLVRRRSFENKPRHTTVVFRREATSVGDASTMDRTSNARHTMTPITPTKMEVVKSHRKPVITPPTTKVTELKPILKTGKGGYESKPEESRVREALSAGLDSKFSYRLPDKPSVPKTKKSVSFKDSDIVSHKILSTRRQYSPMYTVQYAGSVYRPEMLERRQIFV